MNAEAVWLRIATPVSPAIAPAAVGALPVAAASSPAVAADSQDIQKLSLALSGLNLIDRYLLGKDEFGTEYKIFYSGATKITTLGTAGTTKTVDTILQETRGDLLSLLRINDDLSVIWEKQGTKRMESSRDVHLTSRIVGISDNGTSLRTRMRIQLRI